MSKLSLNDRFIYLQVLLEELKLDRPKDEDYAYHTHRLIEKIENRMVDTINQSHTDILDFKALMRQFNNERNDKK